MDTALEMLVKAPQSGPQPPEHSFVQASSYLVARRTGKEIGQALFRGLVTDP